MNIDKSAIKCGSFLPELIGADLIFKEKKFGSHGSVINVPIVFHIVGPQHVLDFCSESVLQTQTTRMNEDFNGSNSDMSNIPTYFDASASHNNNNWNFFIEDIVKIEMAQPGQGQQVGTSNGVDIFENHAGAWSSNLITAADNTSITAGSVYNQLTNPWSLVNTLSNPKINGSIGVNSTKVLNFWAVSGIYAYDSAASISDSIVQLLGYATFPSWNLANKDHGVVCDCRTIGHPAWIGAYNGRTAVHEAGHFFNLRHMWASVEDGITSPCGNTLDLPHCSGYNSGTPTFPHNRGCAQTLPWITASGEMFMNYMDYVNDYAMLMFSESQQDEMISAANTFKDDLGHFPLPFRLSNERLEEIHIDQSLNEHDGNAANTLSLSGSGCLRLLDENGCTKIILGKLRNDEPLPNIEVSETNMEYASPNFLYHSGIPMTSGTLVDGRPAIILTDGSDINFNYFISINDTDGTLFNSDNLKENCTNIFRDQENGCLVSLEGV